MAETSFCSRLISNVKRIFKKNNTATITVKSIKESNPNPNSNPNQVDLEYIYLKSKTNKLDTYPEFLYRDDTFIDYDEK